MDELRCSGWLFAVLITAFSMGSAAIAQDSSPRPTVVGDGRFQGPETALWDERTDAYLVSNVNGGLTALDDNGFISQVLPNGQIVDLKWIDAAKPEVVLHGPKGMLFHRNLLVVANEFLIFESVLFG